MPEKYSEPDGLIPAKVKARFKRANDDFPETTGSGSTVDQEGLLNNYAVEPESSIAKETSLKTKIWQTVAFAAVTWIPISIAIIVTHW